MPEFEQPKGFPRMFTYEHGGGPPCPYCRSTEPHGHASGENKQPPQETWPDAEYADIHKRCRASQHHQLSYQIVGPRMYIRDWVWCERLQLPVFELWTLTR